MDMIQEFYDLANAYCCFISENELTVDGIPFLMEQLMKLYILAMSLPEPVSKEGPLRTTSYKDRSTIRINKQIPRFYWEVFDPFVQEDAVCGDIADDLSDIAADLLSGMREFEAGRIGNAVFEWRFGLNNHWGSHTVDVLRALHAIRIRQIGVCEGECDAFES